MLPQTIHDLKDEPPVFEGVMRRVGGPTRMLVVASATGLAILGAIPEVPDPYSTIIKITAVVFTAASAAIIKNMTPATREKDVERMHNVQAIVLALEARFWEKLYEEKMEKCMQTATKLTEVDLTGCCKEFREAFKGRYVKIEGTLKSVKKQLKEQARQTATQGS